MKKEISFAKVLANKMSADLIDQQNMIEKLKKGLTENEKSKLNKVIDVLIRTREDLWRNCISNPMV